MAKPKRKSPLYCSFCRKTEHAVETLIGGPGVYICGACVDLCNKILAGKPAPPYPHSITISFHWMTYPRVPASTSPPPKETPPANA